MPGTHLLPTQTSRQWIAPSFPVAGEITVSLTTTSATSATVASDIVLVRPRVQSDTSATCMVAWGSGPTASTTVGASCIWAPYNEWTEVHCAIGDKIAGIMSTGTGTLSIRYGRTSTVG